MHGLRVSGRDLLATVGSLQTTPLRVGFSPGVRFCGGRVDQIRPNQRRLEQWRNLARRRAVRPAAAAQRVRRSAGEARKNWVENYGFSYRQLTGMSTARYCKKCKVVFDQIQPTDKCPGAHANFM